VTIKGLQTNQPGLARAGIIRLGYKAKKCQKCGAVIEASISPCPNCKKAEFGKEYPKEAPHFVLSDAPGLAEALGTETPTELRIFFPFDEIDQIFPAFMQNWVSSSLICRGDGEQILYAIELTSGKATVRDGHAINTFREGQKEYKAGQPMPCPGLSRDLYSKCEKCKPNAMLLILMRDVPRLAYYQISTTSIHNIKNLTEQLNTVRQTIQELTGSPRLTGVPFILRRVKRNISTPGGKDGKRQRVEKWFVELEIEPEWMMKMFKAQLQLADPLRRLAIPATVEPEIVQPAPAVSGYSEPPVWEPRDYDEAEEATWEPVEEPAPVATPEPPTNGKPKTESPRPYAPNEVSQKIYTFINKGNYRDKDTQEWLPIELHALGKKTVNILSAILERAFVGDLPESKEGMRHAVLNWLFGVMSAKELTAAQANALIVWLTGKEAVDFNTPVGPFVPAEARAIYDLAIQEAEEDRLRAEAEAKANQVAADILGEPAPVEVELVAEELPF
jgi:hypothetical protein